MLCIGGAFLQRGRDSVVYREQYDGPGTPRERAACKIEQADAGVMCNVTIQVKEKMSSPVNVFYEIEGFHQNHRRYVQSLDWGQLHNREHLVDKELRQGDCILLYENKSKLLNPCGLIPNTMFNDIIELIAPDNLEMKENNIAWRSDIKHVLKQPEGFEWARAPNLNIDDECFEDNSYLSDRFCQRETCAAYGISNDVLDDGCLGYVCQGSYFDEHKCDLGERVVFHYDRVDKYAYLYQTFPQVVSPLIGVNAEHFAVWMRTAALPRFRKLYGRITQTVRDDLVFTIQNNWDAHAFSGKKYVVVASNPEDSGFESTFLAHAYITVGAICLGLGAFFLAVQCVKPRILGDPTLIPWHRKE